MFIQILFFGSKNIQSLALTEFGMNKLVTAVPADYDSIWNSNSMTFFKIEVMWTLLCKVEAEKKF